MTTTAPYQILETVTVKNVDEARRRLTKSCGKSCWLTVNGASYEIWDGAYGRTFTILTEFAPKVRGRSNGPLLVTKVAEIVITAR
jgi:hypothetical protein